MDPLTALDQSAATWRQALELLPTDVDHPSHLSGWMLRDLVNHVHGGGVRYSMYLQGSTGAAAEPTRHADYCSPDPISIFDSTHAQLRAGLADPDRWFDVVEHPTGSLRVIDSLHRRCLELVLHSWDIAKSVDLSGVQMCPMPTELAHYLGGVYAETNGGLDGTDYFAPASPGQLEDPRAELLRLSGRG